MTDAPFACLVAIMRNEGPYVLEWVAHHGALGFDRMLVFTNDCDDGTDLILDRLMEMGQVIHAPNPKTAFGQLRVWQVAALRYAATFGAFRRAAWVMTLDADEFLEIGPRDGSLQALVAAAPAFDLMSFAVVSYLSGRSEIGDGAVRTRFLRPRVGLADLAAPGGPPCAVKTLMRPTLDGAMFRNHRPKFDGFSASGRVWLNGGGHAMPPAFTDRKVNLWSAEGALALGRVAHYPLRSRAAFLVKSLRGDAVTKARIGLASAEQTDNAIRYWQARETAGADPVTPRTLAGAEELLARYRADPELDRLHCAALDTHAAKVARILDTPEGARLAEAIGYG